MYNNLQLFGLNKKIKATVIDGTPYFLFIEVSDLLEYKNKHDALRHVYNEDIKTLKWKDYCSTPIGHFWNNANDFSNKKIVTESGVYDLIIHSEMKEAKKFQYWLTHKKIYDVIKKPLLTNTTKVANKYGISAKKLHSKLNELGIIYKKDNRWNLYDKYKGYDYAYYYVYTSDKNKSFFTLEWTTKGINMIDNALKNNNASA